MKPNTMEFMRVYDELPEWGKDKMYRLLISLKNNSPRAKRLLDMKSAGQMSLIQLLRVI